MAGSALKPDFYNSKVNVALLLAPPVKVKHIKFFSLLELKWGRDLVDWFATTFHIYNILPYNQLQSRLAGAACKLFDGKLCDLVFSKFFDSDA